MTKEERGLLEEKNRKLTILGARDFWNEICEWLDALIVGADRKLHDADTWEEARKYQILGKLCNRMKKLPENMVLTIRAQLAEEGTSGDIKEVPLNFFTAEPQAEKGGENGR